MYNGDKIDKVLRDAAEQARIPNGLTHKLVRPLTLISKKAIKTLKTPFELFFSDSF